MSREKLVELLAKAFALNAGWTWTSMDRPTDAAFIAAKNVLDTLEREGYRVVGPEEETP